MKNVFLRRFLLIVVLAFPLMGQTCTCKNFGDEVKGVLFKSAKVNPITNKYSYFYYDGDYLYIPGIIPLYNEVSAAIPPVDHPNAGNKLIPSLFTKNKYLLDTYTNPIVNLNAQYPRNTFEWLGYTEKYASFVIQNPSVKPNGDRVFITIGEIYITKVDEQERVAGIAVGELRKGIYKIGYSLGEKVPVLGDIFKAETEEEYTIVQKM